MIDPELDRAFEQTWPAAEYRTVGGFRVAMGEGGGGRLNAARAVGHWTAPDVDRVVEVQHGWGAAPLVLAFDHQSDLSDLLTGQGWQARDATVLLQAPVDRLTDRTIPPVTAFSIWPPLAIQCELWDEAGIGPARRAAMARVVHPKAALLGRVRDRAAGTGFVAVCGPVAMVHALAVHPDFRRLGVAGWLVRRAAVFAAEHGAGRIALAVTRANDAGLGFYRALGFDEVGGYRYFSPPGGS